MWIETASFATEGELQEAPLKHSGERCQDEKSPMRDPRPKARGGAIPCPSQTTARRRLLEKGEALAGTGGLHENLQKARSEKLAQAEADSEAEVFAASFSDEGFSLTAVPSPLFPSLLASAGPFSFGAFSADALSFRA